MVPLQPRRLIARSSQVAIVSIEEHPLLITRLPISHNHHYSDILRVLGMVMEQGEHTHRHPRCHSSPSLQATIRLIRQQHLGDRRDKRMSSLSRVHSIPRQVLPPCLHELLLTHPHRPTRRPFRRMMLHILPMTTDLQHLCSHSTVRIHHPNA